jgi:solute carrier family 25 phosphate transporter 23/24/25/41
VGGGGGRREAPPSRAARTRGWATASCARCGARAWRGCSGAFRIVPNCFELFRIPTHAAGLCRGLGANYVKVVPSIAIAFVTYEQVKVALGVEIRIGE